MYIYIFSPNEMFTIFTSFSQNITAKFKLNLKIRHLK